MLISAMDNVDDNKCTNSSDSNETNSVPNIHESEERDQENETESRPNDEDSIENDSNMIQGSSTQALKCFPGTNILQEIDMTEIKFLKAIGKGSFGVVHKAIWAGRTVAVKKVETDQEITAFQNEIKQLSRVKHDNIIQMYGTGTSLHAKCIIMEFAHDGSLYQFLHCPPHSKYNLSHALSWLLQCAKAIAYLHSIEPRPIIHRDLKPLNMLLTNGKKVLKICDFGTACDLRSVMTDNKGSTAWMAPEVIKGCNYNEKCDVYSWGMILWEVLTRRIPFEELGQTYRILWQVVQKARPPLIQGCPKPIERLMKRCWLDEQSERPSMQDVVDVIYPLYRVVSDGEDIIGYSSSSESCTESCMSPLNGESTAGHTSRDISEIASSSTNTNDLPENGRKEAQSADAAPAYNYISVENANQQWPSNFSHTPQGAISPNASASVLVGVENLLPPWGSAKSDEIHTPCALSPTPSHSVIPKSPTRGGDLIPPPSPQDMFSPLSIVIPNGGAGNIPQANFTLKPIAANTEYSPWTFPQTSQPPSTSTASSSPISYLPQSIQAPASSGTPHPYGSQTQIYSPPLTSVATTMTFVPPVTNMCNMNNKISPGSTYERTLCPVPLRRHVMANDSTAMFRRRSAEVPQQFRASILPAQGHRRSSSYESSELIGFEPLADEVLREQQQQSQRLGLGLRAPHTEGGQRKNEKSSHEFWHKEANRISEEVDSSLKCEVDDHPRVSPGHPSTSTNYQRVNYNPGVSVPKGGPVPPLFHNSNAPPRSIGLSPSHKKVTYKGGIISPERAPTPQTRGSGPPATTESDELGAYWQLLDDDLKPTMPQPSCSHSQQIFNEHKELAHQLLVVQEEIVYLDKEKSRMLKKLEEQDREQHACRQRYSDKINQLKSKNESLRQDHSRLSQQLEEITRRQKGSQQNTQQQQQQQQERSTSNQHYIQQPSSNNPISSPFSPHHIQNQAFHHYHDPQQYSPQRQLPLSHQYYYDNPLHPLFPHNMQNH